MLTILKTASILCAFGSVALFLFILPRTVQSDGFDPVATVEVKSENTACTTSTINFGQSIDNALSTTDCYDGTYYYDDYVFSGTAGQQITIAMNSTAVDAYLQLFGPNGQLIAEDDDGGGSTNSRILHTLLVNGTYTVRATSFFDNQIGPYTLSLVDNAASLCTRQAPEMVGWYKGEGNTNDSTGNHPGMSFPGFSGTYSAGKVGQAMNFNGTNNFVKIDERPTPANTLSKAVTLAAWINLITVGGQQTIISKYDIGGAAISLQFSSNGGKLYFQVNQSSLISRSFITTNTVLSAGVYQHVAATFDSSTQEMQIFVNGVSVPLTTVNTAAITAVQGYFISLRLGALANGNQNMQFFGGQIDEVQIFNRLLSTSDIQSIHNAGSAGVCNNSKVSGKVVTSNGRVLDVPIGTANGLKAAQNGGSGNYSVFLELGLNHTIAPKFSSHNFSPPAHSFNPLTGDQPGRDFSATLKNDSFVSAVQLTGESGEIDGNNEEATREQGEPLHANVVGGTSVWYRWRAPRNGQFTFSLGGSKFDTVLAVYRGTNITGLSQIAANDNIPNTAGFSQVTFQAAANNDYHIAVDGRAGGSGSGDFKMIYRPADSIPGITVSGTVKDTFLEIVPVQGATVKAERMDGTIIASTLTAANGAFAIVIPQGVTSFKLTAFDHRYVFGFTIFTNITQNQTYNFLRPQPGSFVVIRGAIFGITDSTNLRVTASAAGGILINCFVPPVEFGEVEYTCPGLLPNVTYTVAPSFPSSTFTPDLITLTNLDVNVLDASFVNNNGSGFNISGKVTHGGVPLRGVRISAQIPSSIHTETDINGDYIFRLPAGRNILISASLPSFSFQPLESFFSNLQSDQTANFTAASTCPYALSGQQQLVPSAGGFYSFNITTNAGCAWEARTHSAGLTVISPLSFASGTISYFVEVNAGAARTGTITVAGQTFTINQAAAVGTGSVLFDYDADGRADLSVWRPSDNNWYIQRTTAGYTVMTYGVAGDRIAPADYDGDGKTDVAVFRPSNGIWYVFNSATQTFTTTGWGQNGDLPAPADHDGDGKADFVVFRPSNNTWYLRMANNAQSSQPFGAAGDKPVVGDFDGDGKSDIGVFRPSDNNWYVLRTAIGFTIHTWGQSGDIPIPADYDGDGKTDLAVFRPSTGQWFMNMSTAGIDSRFWGEDGDIPVAADYDGDGKADIAVFRPSNGTWHIIGSTAGIMQNAFGQSGDLPTQGAFVY